MKEEPTAEYMFGLLGYSTWNLYRGTQFVAQVTLNEGDRSVSLTYAHSLDRDVELDDIGDWRHWMQWLRRHRHHPL
jgi:hypothetical protein